MTPAQVRAMPIQQVVDDPEWQAVRKSLIGHWVNNHNLNVKVLRDYMVGRWDDPLAVRRVLNVLTGSVHRAGYTKGQASTDALRYEIRYEWADMLGDRLNGIRGEI